MTERKGKTQGKADVYRNMAVSLKSGLSFKMGQPIRPTVLDIRQVFGKLYASQYAEDVIDRTMVPDLLVRCNQQELDILVPLVAKKIDYLLMWGDVGSADEAWVVTCGYVLAWYWHLNLGGARPVLESIRQRKANAWHQKITPTRPDLRCPFCWKQYPDTDKYVKYSVLAKHWMGWLVTHFHQYHKEWGDARLDFQDPIKHQKLTGKEE